MQVHMMDALDGDIEQQLQSIPEIGQTSIDGNTGRSSSDSR